MYSYLLGKEGYVFCGAGLSVCYYSRSYEQIAMKFYGGVQGDIKREQVINMEVIPILCNNLN